jgi:hypothetical protein
MKVNRLSAYRLVRMKYLLLTGCALLSVRPCAWTRLPVPYEFEGTIAAIDQNARSLTVTPVPHAKLGWRIKPTKFAWSPTTEFIKDGEPSDPALLQVGDHVSVYYQFAAKKQPPMLVKVVWLHSPSAPERGRSPSTPGQQQMAQIFSPLRLKSHRAGCP